MVHKMSTVWFTHSNVALYSNDADNDHAHEDDGAHGDGAYSGDTCV